MISGHSKAVSYVRFMGGSHVVSASTDSQLKLWDIAKASEGGLGASQAECSYTGHTNEKNFVGLSVSPDGYIMCGSENNAVRYVPSHPNVPMSSSASRRRCCCTLWAPPVGRCWVCDLEFELKFYRERACACRCMRTTAPCRSR